MTAPDLVRSERDHGVEHHWILTGPFGSVAWGLMAGDTFGPVQMCSVRPMWDAHESGECDLAPALKCYSDFGFRGGNDIGKAWQAADRDDQIIWSELEGWYNTRLRDIKFVPVDVAAAMGVHGPLHLRDEELRAVLVATIAGETIQDAIRAAYRARRARFRNLASAKSYPEPLREEVWRELCEEYSEHDSNPFDLLNALRAELSHGDHTAAEVTLDAITGVPR